MENIVLVLTSSAIAAGLLIVGSIEVFAYKMMSKHIISLTFLAGHVYTVGDGILHTGKKYVIIHVNGDRVIALKTLSNIINDWRNK